MMMPLVALRCAQVGCARPRSTALYHAPAPIPPRPHMRRPTPIPRPHVARAVVIPDAFGYVLGSCAVTCCILYWMSFQVAFARKRHVVLNSADTRSIVPAHAYRPFCFSSFNVPYPKMYAEGDSEDAVGFNCVQRGHQNSLELAPQAFVLQILMGLKFPITASILGVAWALGRILYFTGYASGDPRGRIKGAAVAGLVWLALVFGTMYTGYVMVRVA